MKNAIKKYKDRNVFFMAEYRDKADNELLCEDVNDYIKYMSVYATSINAFGCSEENLRFVREPLRINKLMLNQLDWVYTILTKDPKSVVINAPIYLRLEKRDKDIKRSVMYNLYEIHLKNYYDIMAEYMGEKPFITYDTVKSDKDKWLKHYKMHLIYTYVYRPPTYPFKVTGCSRLLWRYMRGCPRLYLYMACFPLCLLMYPYFRIVHGPSKLKYLWQSIKER